MRISRKSTKVDIVDYPQPAGHNGTALNAIKRSVSAADFAYDAAMMAGYDTCALTSTQFLQDLNAINYLDLSKPWWDQKANADLTIKGKMFYTTGDISTADNDATYAIMFNKQLVSDYRLPRLLLARKERHMDNRQVYRVGRSGALRP